MERPHGHSAMQRLARAPPMGRSVKTSGGWYDVNGHRQSPAHAVSCRWRVGHEQSPWPRLRSTQLPPGDPPDASPSRAASDGCSAVEAQTHFRSCESFFHVDPPPLAARQHMDATVALANTRLANLLDAHLNWGLSGAAGFIVAGGGIELQTETPLALITVRSDRAWAPASWSEPLPSRKPACPWVQLLGDGGYPRQGTVATSISIGKPGARAGARRHRKIRHCPPLEFFAPALTYSRAGRAPLVSLK